MLSEFLGYIARTNLFNFIIFASIIALIFIKLDVIGALENAKNSVSDTIKSSENAKSDSEVILHEAEDKISNLSEEVSSIINLSADNAKLVGDKIISDTNNTIENIRLNSEKLVENKTEVIRNDIFKRASLASVEVAKSKIMEELNNNIDLHNKLIDESVEQINGVEV